MVPILEAPHTLNPCLKWCWCFRRVRFWQDSTDNKMCPETSIGHQGILCMLFLDLLSGTWSARRGCNRSSTCLELGRITAGGRWFLGPCTTWLQYRLTVSVSSMFVDAWIAPKCQRYNYAHRACSKGPAHSSFSRSTPLVCWLNWNLWYPCCS